MTTPSSEEAASVRTRIAAAAGTALLVAGLLLVAVVLPAEYGVDPLGTGARLGLVELGITGQQVDKLNAETAKGGPAQGAIIVGQDRPFSTDSVEFVLAPREGMEYKYRLEKGESLLYSWTATAPVNVEFHAEPDGAPRGYAQTYEKKDAQRDASGADLPHLLCRGPLLPLDDVELNGVPFSERLEPLSLDRAEVHETILLAVVRGDESEPLRVVEPLHLAGRTHALLLRCFVEGAELRRP